MRINEIISTTKDKWILNAPSLHEIIRTNFPHEYFKLIIESRDLNFLIKAYTHSRKVLATKILKNFFSDKLTTINDDDYEKLRSDWVNAITKKTLKVAGKEYDRIIFAEKYGAFLKETEEMLGSKILPRPETSKIIPHLNLSTLHKSGRLRGRLFNYKIKCWYFSQSDAERIATEEYELIAKYKSYAQDRAIQNAIIDNTESVEKIIFFEISEMTYGAGIGCDEQEKLIRAVMDMPSIKHNLKRIDKFSAWPPDVEAYVSNYIVKKYQSDAFFRKEVQVAKEKYLEEELLAEKECEEWVKSLEE